MSEERRKILYAVLEEAAAQKVHVEDWAFVEAMNTNFYGHQGKIQKQFKGNNEITLNVRNVELFEEKMNAYVDSMLQFLHEHPLFYAYDNVYYDGHQEAQEKYLMTVLWSNATPEDFENPVSFLERRI